MGIIRINPEVVVGNPNTTPSDVDMVQYPSRFKVGYIQGYQNDFDNVGTRLTHLQFPNDGSSSRPAHSPSDGSNGYEVLTHNAGQGSWMSQLAIGHSNDSIAFRRKGSGNWSNWMSLYTSCDTSSWYTLLDGAVRYRRAYNFIEVSLYGYRAGSPISISLGNNQWTQLATLPNGYRPTNAIYGVVELESNATRFIGRVSIESNGTIQINQKTGSAQTIIDIRGYMLFPLTQVNGF